MEKGGGGWSDFYGKELTVVVTEALSTSKLSLSISESWSKERIAGNMRSFGDLESTGTLKLVSTWSSQI